MNSQHVQRIVFGVFILLFFVSAPLVVLYTAGYRWNTSVGVVRTGTFFVSSTPKDAIISINNNPHKDKTPAIIKTLKPATYTVRMDRSGYFPWEKSLTIHEGQTTFADNVLLFLDTGSQLIIREDMHSVAWSPSGTHMAFASHQAGWTEVWISSIERPASRLVYRVPLDDDITLTWPNNNELTIDQEDGQQRVSREGALLAQTDTEARVTFEPNGDTINILVSNNVLARLPFGDYTVVDQRGDFILVHDALLDRISLLTTADSNEPLLLQEDASWVDWLHEDALIFANAFSISMYEPSKHQTTLITRISDRIENIKWHPDGRYIFYTTDTELRAVELDNRNGRRETTLATMERVDDFFVHPRGQIIYLVGDNGIDTGLFSRELYRK